ncbi:neoverrucotoxin subunit alpha-like protein, partial [Lates japonicus]
VGDMDSDQIVVAALGRPFALGMLYDARKDKLNTVTGILYGAHAFFVFDSEKLDSSSIQDIQGCMEAVVKKIPSFSLEGKADVKLTDEEKATTNKFSCKFYGDFLLESNPATFEDAVKTYQRLPKLLGENGENSVPVKVWLTPLKDLVPTALELKGDICVGLLRKAENALEDQSELDREVLDLDVKDALCFVFTSLKTTDPYLDQMKHYLCSHESQDESVAPQKRDQWYFSGEVLTKMRQKARAFYDITKGLKNSSGFCFLVAAIPNEKYKGATIYHYRDGKLVTENFSKPGVPDAENVTDRRDLLWYACDLNLDPDTANSYLILSEGNKKARSQGTWQSYPDLPQRRVRVFLDYPAGSVSFFKVSHNSLSHVHTYKARLNERLYPGLYAYHTSNYAALCVDL